MKKKNTFKKFVKILATPILQRYAKWYFSSPRSFSYRGINIIVEPGVFHPHFTFSTKILMDQISDLEMRDKNFLELGCGAGMISILAAKKGAKVTASDISKLAIKNCRNNAENNNVKILVTESDLFANIHQNEFDYIIINPPYYPKEPKNIAEKAWYCGVNFEYFTRLFSQLKNIKYQNAILILSEDCNINRIKEIATQNFVELLLIRQQRHYIETNFVYKLIT